MRCRINCPRSSDTGKRDAECGQLRVTAWNPKDELDVEFTEVKFDKQKLRHEYYPSAWRRLICYSRSTVAEGRFDDADKPREVNVMKKMLMLVGCVVLAGGASAATRPTSYGVAMTSKLAQGQYMALHIEGTPACFGEISASKPVKCESVSALPRMVKVVWGPPSSWESPRGNEQNLPAGWKVPTGSYQQQFLTTGWLRPPWWFRSGDMMVFTINRMHRLSVTYQCHRPGHACVSYPPVTVFGVPQGVASVTH